MRMVVKMKIVNDDGSNSGMCGTAIKSDNSGGGASLIYFCILSLFFVSVCMHA